MLSMNIDSKLLDLGSGTVINAAKAKPDDVILILGLGGVGLSAIMGAKVQGQATPVCCRTIIGVDRIESRLKLASELGATHTIDGSKLGDKTLVEAIREVADGIGPTIAIDTTGAPPLIKAGIEAIRNKGRYIQVGSAPFDFQCEFNMFTFMVAGKSVQGAIEGEAYPAEFVPQMIKWYREGRFPIDKLIKFMPAEDFEQALKEM
ncbi:hypothetical protein LTS01_020980 [Friedmanniomyces endolithicus]|nr:hypothetical protein LTS01_020980 [Friedmanniomyces endolithicus]